MIKFPQYPRISRENFVSWNEEMFKKYNNERVYNHSNPLIRFIERQRVNTLIKMLGVIRKEDKILAAGCGEGYIENQLQPCILEMVDISKEAIVRARVKLKERQNVHFTVSNLEDLDFKNETFDKIECSEVIEHVYSPEAITDEFYRVLKDNGTLVMSFPNEPLINFIKRIFISLGIFTFFFPNVPKDMTEEWHLHAFDLNKFKNITEKKWKMIKAQGIPFNFLPVRYVVKCQKIISDGKLID